MLLLFYLGKFSINELANSVGPEKCIALPVFHSFTGCDNSSSFMGKGQKSTWKAWKCYLDVTDAFMYIA